MSDQESPDVVCVARITQGSEQGQPYSVRRNTHSQESERCQTKIKFPGGKFMKLNFFHGLVATDLPYRSYGFTQSSIKRDAPVLPVVVPSRSCRRIQKGATRLATFRNPYVMPTDGKTVTRPAGCGWLRGSIQILQ